MNMIKNLIKSLATKMGTLTEIDDEAAKLMCEMDARVADLAWPTW